MKTINTLFVALILSAVMVSCQKHSFNNMEIITIDVNESIGIEGSLKLSDLVSDLEIIRFDTVQEAFFGEARSVTVGKNKILISCNQPKKLLLFDRKGKLIRSVGRLGEGPGEYLIPYISGMDPGEQFIFLADYRSDRLIKYSISGAMIKQVKISQHTPAMIIDGLKFIDADHFTLITRRSSGPSDDYHSVITFDLDLNPGKKYLHRKNDENLLLTNLMYNNLEYSPKGLTFWETCFDTLFYLNPDGTEKPAYRFNISSGGISPDSYKDAAIMARQPKDYIAIRSLLDLPGFILASGIAKRTRFELIYNKETKETFALNHLAVCDTTQHREQSIENDLFGVEPIKLQNPIIGSDFSQNHLLCMFRPGRFLYTHNLEELGKLKVKYPKIRDEFIQMSKTAPEEELVLVLMKIKK